MVRQLQVGVDVEMATHTNGQRPFHHAHRIEVQGLEVGAQCTIKAGSR